MINYNIIENIYYYIYGLKKFVFVKSVLIYDDYEYAVKNWSIEDIHEYLDLKNRYTYLIDAKKLDLANVDICVLEALTGYISNNDGVSLQHGNIINNENVFHLVEDTLCETKEVSNIKNLCKNIKWLSNYFSFSINSNTKILACIFLRKWYNMYEQLKFKSVGLNDAYKIVEYFGTYLDKINKISEYKSATIEVYENFLNYLNEVYENFLNYLNLEKSNITDNLLVYSTLNYNYDFGITIIKKYDYTYNDLLKKIDEYHTLLSAMFSKRYCLSGITKCNGIINIKINENYNVKYKCECKCNGKKFAKNCNSDYYKEFFDKIFKNDPDYLNSSLLHL